MPTIFLSHTSIDKPFVEKLARDLQRLGISVWYDKYEIKVGRIAIWRPIRMNGIQTVYLKAAIIRR